MDRPFVGIIAGLVFNGIRFLDLAAERDPRIQLRGDIELLTSIPADYRQRFKDNNQSMQRAPESAYPNVVDDLVFPEQDPVVCPARSMTNASHLTTPDEEV